MYSKARLFGHPLHPMLVAYPIAFYTATLVAYAIAQAGGGVFWFKVGIVANLAGLITAALAAAPGFVDWFLGIPGGTEAKTSGFRHMVLNDVALALFIANAAVNTGRWGEARPNAVVGIVLAALGLACTVAAGFYGWSLIQDYHVGVVERAADAPAAHGD